jgi:hypothetical protein
MLAGLITVGAGYFAAFATTTAIAAISFSYWIAHRTRSDL